MALVSYVARRFATLDLQTLPPQELYRALSDLIVPRPIAFVSTVNAEGQPNLAPFSFFMMGGSNPPSICFSPTRGREGEKDTLENIRATGEMTVNLVTRTESLGMNATAAAFPRGHSEWEASGFTPFPSTKVLPARVAECAASLEARLVTIVEHGDSTGAARYVIGEIVAVHLDERLLGNTPDFRPIARLGGADYLDMDSGERFELKRPL